MSFKGKVVIVTGSSSGLGAAIAIKFAEHSANVVLVGRNETKLANIEEKCKKFGVKPLVVNADVANEDAAKRIIKETVDEFGKIDVLVNNAGIVRMAAIASPNILQSFDDTMNTNLRAVFHLTHLALPHLETTKGNIINISSIGAKQTPAAPAYVTYNVSKAALDHFSKCAAREFAPKGIRVNVVNPGPFKTDIAENSGFNEQQSAYFWQKMLEGTALGKLGEVEEIGDLVVYLASDKAKSITGSTFVCDNGMLLK